MNIFKKIFGDDEPKNSTQTTETKNSIPDKNSTNESLKADSTSSASNETQSAVKSASMNAATDNNSSHKNTPTTNEGKSATQSTDSESSLTTSSTHKTMNEIDPKNTQPSSDDAVSNHPASQNNQSTSDDANTSSTQENSEADMKEMMKRSFLLWESTFRHQEISLDKDITFPRSNFEKFVTVRELLETLYPSLKDSFTGKNYMSKVSENTISTGCAKEIEDILNVSPFAFVFKQEDEHQLAIIDESFAVTLEYKGTDSNIYYLHLFVKVLGQAEHSVYLRVSTMKPEESADDMMTIRTHNMPECYSAVLAYDVLDASEDLKFYEEKMTSATKKLAAKEELDDYETEAINGMYGIHLPPYNYGFANWLFEKERYYDAYMAYLRVYNVLKPNAYALDKDSREVFFNTCFHMGACLQMWGVLDKACYFFELASNSGVNEHIAAYVNILALLSHNRAFYFLNQVRSQADKNEAAKQETQRLETLMSTVESHYKYPETYNSSVLTLGYVLNHMFDVDPRCVLGATINHTGETSAEPSVVGQTDAWNLNLYDLKDTVIYVRYSRAQWQTNFKEDKSILCSDNAIIVSLSSVFADDGKPCVRVNAMIPNFGRNDEKRDFVRCNLPITGTFAMGAERPDQVFDKDQLKEIYKHSTDLLNQRRIFEAMQGFEYIHAALKIEYTKASSDDSVEELFFDATYQLGFCLVELGLYEKATYYLDWAQEGQKAEYAQEYINCLCNNRDIRALAVIEGNLKALVKPEEPEYQEAYEFHKSFLLRRKAFALINVNRMDEAEKLLNELLKDPASKDFAEHELESIRQMRAARENVK